MVIGRVTEGNSIRLIEGGKVVADIPEPLLTDDAPVYDRPSKRPANQDELNTFDLSKLPEPKDYNATLISLMSSMNLASREWIYRQYDHMVRTDTVVCPGSDAAVVRIKGTKKALALTADCSSRYCYLDPRTGGKIAVAEAARNLVSSGAKPMALTDCLNFGNPERPEVMWQLIEAIEGIKEACHALGVPVVSGNVSLYNETSGTSVYPTPTIGMVGLIEDLTNHTREWFLEEGDLGALLGVNASSLGGSEYLSLVHKLEKGLPPAIDLVLEKAVQEACLKAVRAGTILSAHDVSEGGLSVALRQPLRNPAPQTRYQNP